MEIEQKEVIIPESVNMEEDMKVLMKEYEKLKKENEKLQRDKEVCDEVLDYIVKGAEQVINEWGKEIE